MVQLSDKLRPCSSISHSPKNLELAHSKRCWWWPILLGTPNENWHVPLKRTFHLPNINFQGICLFFGGFSRPSGIDSGELSSKDLPTRVGLSDRKGGFVVLDYMSEIPLGPLSLVTDFTYTKSLTFSRGPKGWHVEMVSKDWYMICRW